MHTFIGILITMVGIGLLIITLYAFVYTGLAAAFFIALIAVACTWIGASMIREGIKRKS
jgi:hypothetical protein